MLSNIKANQFETSEQQIDKSMMFFSGGYRAKRVGSKIKHEEKKSGVNIVYTDKCVSSDGVSEVHQSTQSITLELSKISENEPEIKKTLNIFGISAVYADETDEMSKSKDDKTGSIVIKLVVDYEVYERAKGDFVKLTKVKSSLSCCNGRRSPGSGISIKSNVLRVGASGVYPGGKQTESKKYNLSTVPYTNKAITPPSSWKAVSVETCTVGATQVVTLTRGTKK